MNAAKTSGPLTGPARLNMVGLIGTGLRRKPGSTFTRNQHSAPHMDSTDKSIIGDNG